MAKPADAAAATTPASIESEIEETRERLAGTIDQLAYRASPKTIVRREVDGASRRTSSTRRATRAPTTSSRSPAASSASSRSSW